MHLNHKQGRAKKLQWCSEDAMAGNSQSSSKTNESTDVQNTSTVHIKFESGKNWPF